LPDNNSPIGITARGAFLWVLVSTVVVYAIPANSYADPFLTRDQNPFTLVYGQPLPTPARLPPPAKLKYAVSLDIANTLNVETNSGESLYVDFEAYNLTIGGIYAFNQRWALKLDIPFIYRSGGAFDHAIDEWHKLFGLPRADRPNVADNQFSIVYASPASAGIDLSSSTSSIADSQLGFGYSLYQDTKSAVSAWGAVDLPLGDSSKLTGNDELDYSLWLAGSNMLGELAVLDGNIGAVLPGDSVLAGLETEDLVAFGHVGAHLAVHRAVALKLQLAGHSGYYKNTSLEFLGSSVVIIFGGSINIGRCSAIDIGFSEDIYVGTSPDASLLISWRSQLAC
jgi:hypothetical protein